MVEKAPVFSLRDSIASRITVRFHDRATLLSLLCIHHNHWQAGPLFWDEDEFYATLCYGWPGPLPYCDNWTHDLGECAVRTALGRPGIALERGTVELT